MKVFWFGRFLFGGPNGQAQEPVVQTFFRFLIGGPNGQAKEPGFHESCCRFLIGGLDSQAQEPGLFFDWRGLCGQ